jgi:DNA mismatch repair protein MutS
LRKIPDLKRLIKIIENKSLDDYSTKFSDVSELVKLIDKALKPEPSVQTGTGNVFNQGWNEELDEYIDAKFSGKNWVASYQETERQNSGISTLKVGFTGVFGYYIEITKMHQAKVPESYERKQTLANAERYTTPQLKEIERKILSAEEKISELESKLFSELLKQIANYTESIQNNASIIAAIDVLQTFAKVSIEYNYVKPDIDDSEIIEIIDGRHPVVERLLPVGQMFSPNSTNLNTHEEQIHIITGPNMSGKSCYLRQTAVIVLLGQIGCYVPAKIAKFGLVDKIFTRVGAQDNITAGESTFLVEMQESANILNNATQKSLSLLDEVGRGTATFDGISIAWAIAEYIHNHIGAKTLFATHYHELNELTDRYKRIANYRVEVIETGSTIIFSHKVVPGGSDYSFGIHVAKMAGLPYDVIERANEIMKTLEEEKSDDEPNKLKQAKPNIKSIKTKKARADTDQLAIFEFRDDHIRERLSQVKIENMTPIQAFNLLAELQKESRM